jgi:hypothetical protein
MLPQGIRHAILDLHQGGQQPGHPIRARRIAGGHRPDLTDAFELADVERVQAHQLAGLAGRHMPRLAVLSLPERAPGPRGEQARRLRGALFEHQQPLPTGRQSGAAQRPLHRAGGHPQLPAVFADTLRSGRRPTSPRSPPRSAAGVRSPAPAAPVGRRGPGAGADARRPARNAPTAGATDKTGPARSRPPGRPG